VFKTFLVGIVLGIAAAAGALYAFKPVDQAREASIVTVAPNGGNVESFHINIPMDRVITGAAGEGRAWPEGLSWPAEDVLANVRTEIFKIRNARDAVVGVGVRTAARQNDETIIDWMIHLPARGSVFAGMEAAPRENGYRLGRINAGSREFERLRGSVSERWVANTSDEDDEDAQDGRIELRAAYVGEPEPLGELEANE
jgi:hypothetical protein